ncbi:MAG: acetylxylan esterase [Candidatus Dormibacteraeota bacterium]|nr:acetylxylan esterase [Candidatus Dormibacteraeota bacterium]
MAVFEMPLDELRTYRGRNPRPDDFDAYWEAALAEARELDPEPSLEPARFDGVVADCFDLWFTGVGGARIHARFWQPKGARGRHPALLRFHGYGRSAPDWTSMLAWAARGYTVAALDCRGQGGSSVDTGGVRGNTRDGHIVRGLDDDPEKLLFRQIFLDTAVLARVVMAREDVDPARVGATGASQGGGLTLACAALVPELKLAAPIYPFLSDYQRVWEMDLAKAAYEELQTYFRLFDPRHERECEVFTRLGYIDVHHLAPRIRAETMLVTGLADQVCPPSTQFAAYNGICAAKRQVLYPDFGHETLPDVDDLVWTFMGGL